MGCSPVCLCLPWLTNQPTDYRTSSVWSCTWNSFHHTRYTTQPRWCMDTNRLCVALTNTDKVNDWMEFVKFALTLRRIIPQSVSDKRIRSLLLLLIQLFRQLTQRDMTRREESDFYVLYLPLHSFEYVIVLSSHKLYNEIVANLLYYEMYSTHYTTN